MGENVPQQPRSRSARARPSSDGRRRRSSRRYTDAAFFDLDRTLLPGSSAPVLQHHLRASGLATPGGMAWLEPIAGLAMRAFDMFGENTLSMQGAKLAARAAAGWSIETVARAAEAAALELESLIQPHALPLIDEHRNAGRALVLATTTPVHLIAALADRLGFDEVIATRWRHDGQHYTGEVDGPFVWGRGKLEAVRAWADAHEVDMRACYAYSDSFYDAPLLDAVGHPTAVNPDPRLALLAPLRRWPVRYLDVPASVPKLAGKELQSLVRPFAQPELFPFASFDIEGIENIPSKGAGLICGNHRSYFDVAALWLTISRSGRSVRFLGKKEIFDAPIIGALAKAAGGIRVDRGTGSGEPLAAATAALAGGELVAIMPQGTIPRGEAFFDPVLKARSGAARLAALTNTPIVPVGLWGTEKVWPRSARVPRLDVLHPPTVTVRVGEPFMLSGRSAKRESERIMAAITELLPPEARVARIPTDDELRLTYPPGAKRGAAPA